MARWGLLSLGLLLTGCATGTPVGLRSAGSSIRHRHSVAVEAPAHKPSEAPRQIQALRGTSGGGSGPAAWVARTALGALVQLDAFEELLRLAGLDERDALPVRGSPLTPEASARLLAVLLQKPVTLGNFPPRMAVGHLLREVLEGGEVSREELLRRVERFTRVAVLRPDGYLAWVRTGRTQQKAVGHLEWKDGAFRAGPLGLGHFYVNSGASFRLADARMQPVGPPVAEVFDDADVISRSLDGAQEAFFELAMALGKTLTYPLDSLASLRHLPAGVAALIAASPAYFERFQYMTRGEQIQAVAKLTTSLLTTWGAAGGTRALAGPLAGAEATVPVLSLSAEGALVLERVAVPVGRAAAVLGASPGAALILQRTGASASSPSGGQGPGQWAPTNESMSGRARAYQEQITGHSADDAYWVGGVGQKIGGIRFDGFKDGVLLEAKGPGYADKFMDSLAPKPWFKNSGATELVEQASRQLKKVRGTGIPIRWHVAEKKAAEAIRKLLKSNDVKGIDVVYTPAL